MNAMQLFSREFLLGFIGMLIGTGYLAEGIKTIPFVARYALGHKKFTGLISALIAGIICAIAYQIGASVLLEEPFVWATIPSTAIMYATASSFAYEWFIKRPQTTSQLPSA